MSWRGTLAWFKDLAPFGAAVLWHSVTILGGTLISVALLIFEHANGQPVSWGFIKWLMVVSVALAFFNAWRDEKKRADLAEGNRKMVGRITGTIMLALRSPTETYVLVPLSIANLGDPSIITTWRLTMNINGQEALAPGQSFRGKFTISGVPGTTLGVEFDESELIELRGGTVPTPTGGQLAGIYLGLMPFGMAEVQAAVDSMRLEFTDIAGNKYSVTPPGPIQMVGNVMPSLIPGIGTVRTAPSQAAVPPAAGSPPAS